jgi:hypothetical protein
MTSTPFAAGSKRRLATSCARSVAGQGSPTGAPEASRSTSAALAASYGAVVVANDESCFASWHGGDRRALSTRWAAVLGCVFLYWRWCMSVRRRIGNLLRGVRDVADGLAYRIDRAYSAELIASAHAQAAQERARWAAEVARHSAAPAENNAPARPLDPLACACCMAVLISAVHLTGSDYHDHRAPALRWVGVGPTFTTAAGIRCAFHSQTGVIQ